MALRMGIEPILDLTDNEMSTQQTHEVQKKTPHFQRGCVLSIMSIVLNYTYTNPFWSNH